MTVELGELREFTRAARHATSYPLIVVGAVGFHYTAQGVSPAVPVLYGPALAFVIIWALQWRTERRHGVGAGRDDALVVGFGVFVASTFVLSTPWMVAVPWSSSSESWPLTALVPMCVGLAVIGARQRNGALVAWSAVMAAAAVIGAVCTHTHAGFDLRDGYVSLGSFVPSSAFLLATIAGGLRYRAESIRSGQ